ncbi:MAG: PEP-CTERM sorting domain-containing protein [Deltaproteobacteria bacterium]|nr:PEP-CTERM sorting domain-containing protein [Deltaproteobacteria bacterium]
MGEKMRRLGAALWVTILVSLPLSPSPVRASTLSVDLLSGGSPAPFAQPPRTGGWQFALSNSQRVTALGFWDEGGDGLEKSHQVGIWTDAGAPLGSIVVDNGGTTIGSAHTGGNWIFVTLGAAIPLGPGTYRIGGVLDTDLQRHQLTGQVPFLIESFAPEVTWLNAAFGPGFGGFVFPSSLSSQDGFYGPNMVLAPAVPEPSTLLLVGIGLGALVYRRRRSAGNRS